MSHDQYPPRHPTRSQPATGQYGARRAGPRQPGPGGPRQPGPGGPRQPGLGGPRQPGLGQGGPRQPGRGQAGPGRPGTRPPRATRPRTARAPLTWALAAAGLVVGLFLFGATIQSFGVEKDAAAVVTAPAGRGKGSGKTAAQVAKPPGVGDAVRDGKFEFVVSRVDCSKSTVGPANLGRTADGKYCVLDLSVKNIADNPQLFLGKAQKAFDVAGTKFTDDELAGLYANHDTQTFLQKIDPGRQVVGKVVFDVPKSTKLATVELHDSFFSGGVQVALS
jgi:hypothetical protein